MMEPRPAVSVIVPAFDSREALGALLQRLSHQTLAEEQVEVIVVDDGSRDGSAEMVERRFPRVRLLRQPRGGAYRARRSGVAASRGAILAFTDADCIPAPDWLERGLSKMAAQGLDIGAGRVDVRVSDPASVVERYDARFNLRQDFYATRLGFGVTANLFVSRAIYDLAGGFDTSLYSGGDQKLCRDAVAAGGRLDYLDDAVVVHPARGDRRELARKTIRVARGRAQAFPTPRYYVPRLLSALPAPYQDPLFAGEPRGFRVRFVALHYRLEALRIASYAAARLRLRLRGRP